jgi:endonuclease/exonuclease/phosphatase family metal-dependent hydrolase
MIWNIGYSGLGDNMDFFYDGGERVRDSLNRVISNFKQIQSFLKIYDSIDFFLLQEVDINSKRSYGFNQFVAIDSLLRDHHGYFGLNYSVDFVPVPPRSPLGRVRSGIVFLSSYPPSSVSRNSYSGNYPWPTRLFMLKRCFLVSRYPLDNQKELVVINLHNSAYDDGSLRSAQLEVLQDFAVHEYNMGNYVLLGGDWNQTPAGFTPVFTEPFDTRNISFLPETFLKDWNVVYSDRIPSNRRIITPYQKGGTPVTVIDFFITSPNIRTLNKQAIDLNFRNSDHNPLLITFRLEKSIS